MPTFWLSLHVPYACRHSGVCCASGWAIPMERERAAPVTLWRGEASWLRPAPGAPDDVAGVLATGADGRCVFRTDACELQRALGPGALPSACQHFPREVLLDDRGVFVTLSHYCPTAADLLFSHEGPVEIVRGPEVVPGGVPEGLDARGVLPPLLRPGMLMDPEALSAWEAHVVRVLTAEDGRSPEEALSALECDAVALQQWQPGGVSLAEAVAALSRRTAPRSVVAHADRAGETIVIRRYLAARAFASWLAYEGGGIRAVLGGLRLVLESLRGEMARCLLYTSPSPRDRG